MTDFSKPDNQFYRKFKRGYVMKNKILFFVFLVLAQALLHSQEVYDTTGGAVKFEFKYQKGDKERILSTVNEDVYYNMVLSHSSTIINRVTSCVTETFPDGSGTLECTFMTSENSTGSYTGKTFSWGEEYKSVFTRSALGVYTIDEKYFMPTVRDVPVFPDKEVKPGESWTSNGHEAHDLRHGFNIQTPYKVPFTATYTYLGKLENLHVFSVKYTMNFDSPSPQGSALYNEYPVSTMGFSDETVYWDAEKGAIDHYTEKFRIVIETSYGNFFEFKGTAHAEVTEFETTNTKEKIEEVQKQADDLGLKNVTVKQGEKGLTLSIENIKFKPDSAVLEESEKLKLDYIAEILKAYPNNDILVSGHTALAGTAKERDRLSKERAESVAAYLINLGVRNAKQIFTQGFGSTKPIAPNTSEAGKAKNRRVEITIMDN